MDHFIGYAIAETSERPWGQVYGIPDDNVLDFRPIRDDFPADCGE